MTNNVTGFIGMAIFLAFVGGLAESIAEVPFFIIVAGVGVMALYDFYESIVEARKLAKSQAAMSAQES